jgi:NAD(P)H-hydrate epimerase
MLPVTSVEEMRAIDAEAQATAGLGVLIQRAGRALAGEVLSCLGTHGAYGRRIAVLAGKGHNGDDGREAASVLSSRGARVTVLDPRAPAEELTAALAHADLLVDAVLGTGFRGTYEAPRLPRGIPVVAADIPSGIDSDTGEVRGQPLVANHTVTFGALKPGHLLQGGPYYTGKLRLAPIGLDASRARAWLIEDQDALVVPQRGRDYHKWRTAVGILAGSPEMPGAACLASAGAARSGAGMIRLVSPGGPFTAAQVLVPDAVSVPVETREFAEPALRAMERCLVAAVGPGLGRSDPVQAAVREVAARFPGPIVLDADGLIALGTLEQASSVLRGRPRPAVLTPHAGEFASLLGAPLSSDPLGQVRHVAKALGVIVLLKGPTTIVASPSGLAYLVSSGSPNLATAGSGDVLTGTIAAVLARWEAEGHKGFTVSEDQDTMALLAAIGAHAHGRASGPQGQVGMVAGDLPRRLADWWSQLAQGQLAQGQLGPGQVLWG